MGKDKITFRKNNGFINVDNIEKISSLLSTGDFLGYYSENLFYMENTSIYCEGNLRKSFEFMVKVLSHHPNGVIQVLNWYCPNYKPLLQHGFRNSMERNRYLYRELMQRYQAFCPSGVNELDRDKLIADLRVQYDKSELCKGFDCEQIADNILYYYEVVEDSLSELSLYYSNDRVASPAREIGNRNRLLILMLMLLGYFYDTTIYISDIEDLRYKSTYNIFDLLFIFYWCLDSSISVWDKEISVYDKENKRIAWDGFNEVLKYGEYQKTTVNHEYQLKKKDFDLFKQKVYSGEIEILENKIEVRS